MKKIFYLIISAAVSMASLSSCSSSEDISGTTKGETRTLVLSIKPVESVLPTQSGAKDGTRTTIISTDPGTTSENTINAITVGIFDNSGNVRTIQEFSGTDITSGTNSGQVTVTTSSIQSDDHILVAVNAPTGTFTGKQKESDFEQQTLGIDAALATPFAGAVGNTELSNNIPMFGAITLGVTVSGSTVTATVPVYHLVSKVSLASLETNFLATGAYPNAIFTPTEIFLINVPNNLYFNNASPYTSSPTFYQGQVSNTTKYKEYLGTGNPLTVNAISGSPSTSWGTQYFYTMPNSDLTNDTRLVIAGKFQTSATDVTGSTVFYPVHINYNSADGSPGQSGQTAKQTYANYNYKLTVVIQGKGANLPTDIIDKQTATVTATVQPFVDATQTNIFN
jgi:hypothetical protein